MKPFFCHRGIGFALCVAMAPALGTAAMLAGVITNEAGQPIRGADVSIEVHDWSTRRLIERFDLRSDASGGYQVDLTPFQNRRQLGVRVSALSDTHSETNRVVTAPPAEMPERIDLRLAPGFPIVGFVSDSESVAIRGATVRAGGRETTTDGDGRYVLRGVPSRHRGTLEISAPGFISFRQAFPEGITFSLEVNAILPFAGMLQGRVLPPPGWPIAPGEIILRVQRLQWRGTIDEEGVFRIDGLPPDLDGALVTVNVPGFPIKEQVFDSFSQEDTPIVMLGAPSAIAGILKAQSGERLAFTPVRLFDVATGSQATTTTDGAGAFRFDCLPLDQPYRLIVLPDRRQTHRRTVDLTFQSPNAEGSFRGRIPLWPEGFRSELAGTLTDDTLTFERSDEGVFGAPVTRYSGERSLNGGWIGTLTALDDTVRGTFQLRPTQVSGAIAGNWELEQTVTHRVPPAPPSVIDTRTPPIAGTLHVDHQLPDGLKIEGRIAGLPSRTENQPPQIRVSGWSEFPPFLAESPVESDGTFRLEGLPASKLELRLVSPTERNQLAPGIVIDTTDGEPLMLRLENNRLICEEASPDA